MIVKSVHGPVDLSKPENVKRGMVFLDDYGDRIGIGVSGITHGRERTAEEWIAWRCEMESLRFIGCDPAYATRGDCERFGLAPSVDAGAHGFARTREGFAVDSQKPGSMPPGTVGEREDGTRWMSPVPTGLLLTRLVGLDARYATDADVERLCCGAEHLSNKQLAPHRCTLTIGDHAEHEDIAAGVKWSAKVTPPDASKWTPVFHDGPTATGSLSFTVNGKTETARYDRETTTAKIQTVLDALLAADPHASAMVASRSAQPAKETGPARTDTTAAEWRAELAAMWKRWGGGDLTMFATQTLAAYGFAGASSKPQPGTVRIVTTAPVAFQDALEGWLRDNGHIAVNYEVTGPAAKETMTPATRANVEAAFVYPAVATYPICPKETAMQLRHGEATDKGDHFWYIGTCGAAVTSETIPEIVRLATERGKPVKADVNGVAVTAYPGCHVEGLAKAWLAALDSNGDVVSDTWWPDVNFLCPECASINQWGSSRQPDGSFRRSCHGHLVQPDGSGKGCRFSWPAADDARWLKNQERGDAWAVPDAPAAKTVTIHADALKPGEAVVVAKRPVFPAQPTSGGHVSQIADNEFRWVEAPSAKPGDVAPIWPTPIVLTIRAGDIPASTVNLTPQAAALRAALSTIDALPWSAADKRALRDAAHAVAEMAEATDGKAPAALRGPVTEALAALASAAHVGPGVIGEATKARDAARVAMGRRK